MYSRNSGDWLSVFKEDIWNSFKPQNTDFLRRLLGKFIETDNPKAALIVYAEDVIKTREDRVKFIEEILNNKVKYNILQAGSDLEFILILSYLKIIGRVPNLVISDNELFGQLNDYKDEQYMNFLERLVVVVHSSLFGIVRNARGSEDKDHKKGKDIIEMFINLGFLKKEICVMASGDSIEGYENIGKFTKNQVLKYIEKTVPGIARRRRKIK